MSNYTKSTNFTAKDALPSGDSGKIVRGSELDGEFSPIATAIATKADTAGPTFTGTATMAGLTVTGTFTLGGTAITATAVELNKLDGVTATTAELNYVDGVTSNIQTQLDDKAPIDAPDFTTSINFAGWGLTEPFSDHLFLRNGVETYGFRFIGASTRAFAIAEYGGFSATSEVETAYIKPSASSFLMGSYSGSSTGLFLHKYDAGANNTFPLRFYVNGVERGYIQSSSTGTAYNTSSDARLKENIVDAPDVTESLSNIKVRSFDWSETGQHQKYGVVAQEVLDVFPEVVSESDEGMYSVDYSRFVPMLIKEIQSLRQEVNALKGE